MHRRYISYDGVYSFRGERHVTKAEAGAGGGHELIHCYIAHVKLKIIPNVSGYTSAQYVCTWHTISIPSPEPVRCFWFNCICMVVHHRRTPAALADRSMFVYHNCVCIFMLHLLL